MAGTGNSEEVVPQMEADYPRFEIVEEEVKEDTTIGNTPKA